MCIENSIMEFVSPAIRSCDYDADAVLAGITAYAQDNGFFGLPGNFDESVIKAVIKNNMTPVLEKSPEHIVLYFSCYRLVEKVRVINNRSLALAKRSRSEGPAEPAVIQSLERDFEECLTEVCRTSGLRELLEIQISEIILNIDYAKGFTFNMGQRLSGEEIVNA